MPSNEAMEHLALLFLHRPDPARLVVEVHPSHCPHCQELAAWSEFLKSQPPDHVRGGETR
jgi:hypothetical protein